MASDSNSVPSRLNMRNFFSINFEKLIGMMRNKGIRDIGDHKDRKHVLDASSSLPFSHFYIFLASFLLVTTAEWPWKVVDS